MKKTLLLLAILAMISFTSSKKSRYNLEYSKKSGNIIGSRIEHYDKTKQATLIKGGYFTLGTINGMTDGIIDNYCQITYGHPYALTSFPIFKTSQGWISGETFFGKNNQSLEKLGDVLSLEALGDSIFSTKFTIEPIAQTGKTQLLIELTNQSDITQSIAAGFIADFALGHYGDGCIHIDGKAQTTDTIIDHFNQSSFTIFERQGNSKGLQVAMNFLEREPKKMIVGNWEKLYHNQLPNANLPEQLYDMAVRTEYPETNLEPGQSYTVSFVLDILPKIDNAQLFMRWEVPQEIEIIDNKPFPSSIKSYVEILNTAGQDFPDLKLELRGKYIANTWKKEFIFKGTADNSMYFEVPVEIMELYEAKTFPLTLSLYYDDKIIDKIEKNIHVPSSPFSDKGLVTNIDSLSAKAFPEIEVYFQAAVEETGQLIYDLKNTNVFLYEDGKRIQEFELSKDLKSGTNMADIIFVLDVTGSMGDEIANVKENIVEFADSLKKNGIDYRLGMVTFYDYIGNIYPFTFDVNEFRGHVSEQRASGGGDTPENSIEALYKAANYEFRPEANRTIIWITDANYHENNQHTQFNKDDIINECLAKGITVHCLGNTQFQTEYYDQVVMNTGGNFYDIYGNFRDVFLDISRTSTSGKYLLTYTSTAPKPQNHSVKVEVHYAGLGAENSKAYNSFNKSLGINNMALKCYPNPFVDRFKITISGDYSTGCLQIYDVLGKQVFSKQFSYAQNKMDITGEFLNVLEKQQEKLLFINIELMDAKGTPCYNHTQSMIYQPKH